MTSKYMGVISGVLLGAAVGAIWVMQADRRTQRMFRDQGVKVKRMARRTARAMRASARRLQPAIRTGRAVLASATRTMR